MFLAGVVAIRSHLFFISAKDVMFSSALVESVYLFVCFIKIVG